MGFLFKFDDADVRTAAERLEEAFSGVSASGYESCADCGSALVADTVALFVDRFTSSVREVAQKAERTGGAMTECADDFTRLEAVNVQASRALMNVMND